MSRRRYLLKKNNQEKRSNCPINFALELFGDKWSLLIVRDIIFFKKKTFKEFLTSDEKIATNILADRLRKLEHIGILTKTPDAHDKRKETYQLTKKGIDLVSLLVEIMLWSAQYDPHSIVPKDFITDVNQDRKRLITDLQTGKRYHPKVSE